MRKKNLLTGRSECMGNTKNFLFEGHSRTRITKEMLKDWFQYTYCAFEEIKGDYLKPEAEGWYYLIAMHSYSLLNGTAELLKLLNEGVYVKIDWDWSDIFICSSDKSSGFHDWHFDL